MDRNGSRMERIALQVVQQGTPYRRTVRLFDAATLHMHESRYRGVRIGRLKVTESPRGGIVLWWLPPRELYARHVKLDRGAFRLLLDARFVWEEVSL